MFRYLSSPRWGNEPCVECGLTTHKGRAHGLCRACLVDLLALQIEHWLIEEKHPISQVDIQDRFGDMQDFRYPEPAIGKSVYDLVARSASVKRSGWKKGYMWDLA